MIHTAIYTHTHVCSRTHTHTDTHTQRQKDEEEKTQPPRSSLANSVFAMGYYQLWLLEAPRWLPMESTKM